jgi:hypothetical protein
LVKKIAAKRGEFSGEEAASEGMPGFGGSHRKSNSKSKSIFVIARCRAPSNPIRTLITFYML